MKVSDEQLADMAAVIAGGLYARPNSTPSTNIIVEEINFKADK